MTSLQFISTCYAVIVFPAIIYLFALYKKSLKKSRAS